MFEEEKLVRKNPGRKPIGRQVREARKRDRDEGHWYQKNRTGKQYIEMLRGVHGLFQYIRTLPHTTSSPPTVLDIGAGTTAGIDDLAKSPVGKDLQFKATVLTRHPDIEQHLGKKNVRQTSAEVLRGFPDESVACALSVFSIAYSVDPEYVIRTIDRVLMPGGVLKAVFSNDGDAFSVHGVRTPRRFKEALRTMVRQSSGRDISGFEVAVDDSNSVLLAIKLPKPKHAPSAEELLQEDQDSEGVQLNLIGGRMRYE